MRTALESTVENLHNCGVLTRSMDIAIDYNGLPLTMAVQYKRGEKGTIVCIHGLGCTQDSFKGIWSPKFKSYSRLTFDLIGFGDSAKPASFPYTMEAHADVCHALMTYLDIDTLHVVAHSMGGAVALLLAEKIPEKVRSFVNVEGNLIGEDCTMSREVVRMPYPDFEKTFTQMKQKMKGKDRLSRLLYAWLCKSDPYGFYYSAKSLIEWSDSGKLLDLFLTLPMKKVYVYGDENARAPVLDVIEKIKTVPILNSGHFMMVENPQAFYCTLLAFLEDGALYR